MDIQIKVDELFRITHSPVRIRLLKLSVSTQSDDSTSVGCQLRWCKLLCSVFVVNSAEITFSIL